MENRIHIIGLVVPDLTDTHFARLATGVAKVMQPLGYTVLISNSEGDRDSERQAIDLLLSCSHVEGLIMASAQAPDDAGVVRRLEKHKLPFVLIDRDFAGVEANYVGADDEEIGAVATEHLIARGCRHIAHIEGPETSAAVGRAEGYAAALGGHGLRSTPGYVVRAGSSDAAGYEAMRRLLKVIPRVDGVVCYNDAVAVGAIKAILEAGLEVPYDIEVVGAGNVHYSDILRVPLSTIDLNSVTQGERAAELLATILQSKEPRAPQRIVIPFELVARESSRALPV
ncbi:MAG TPA: substrate-binding domain-containing protein [Bryobacteraceae bacterium]|nr:substrate-binding domain-containing protein [Bryobacteraceae bacterium]